MVGNRRPVSRIRPTRFFYTTRIVWPVYYLAREFVNMAQGSKKVTDH
jgi:hypothetical protein